MMKRLLLMLAMFALPCLVWAQEPAYSFIVFPDYQYMSSGADNNKLAAVPMWIGANKATYAPNLLFMASTGDDVDTIPHASRPRRLPRLNDGCKNGLLS